MSFLASKIKMPLIWAFIASLIVGCSVLNRYELPDKQECRVEVYIKVPQELGSYKERAVILPIFLDPKVRAETAFSKQLSRVLGQSFLREGVFPVVEVSDRYEPIVREEFFLGNHNAIRLAKEIGADYLVLGYFTFEDKLPTLYLKILGSKTAITHFYGKAQVQTTEPFWKIALEEVNWYQKRHNIDYLPRQLSKCLIGDLYADF